MVPPLPNSTSLSVIDGRMKFFYFPHDCAQGSLPSWLTTSIFCVVQLVFLLTGTPRLTNSKISQKINGKINLLKWFEKNSLPVKRTT